MLVGSSFTTDADVGYGSDNGAADLAQACTLER